MVTVTAVTDGQVVTVPSGDALNLVIPTFVGTVTVKGGGLGDYVDLGPGNHTLIGKGGGDYLPSSGGTVVFKGGSGNDYMNGGTIQTPSKGDDVVDDTFVFSKGSGKDVIENFEIGRDVIKIKNVDGIDSVKDVLKHASQSGDNVVIKLGDGNKITLLNVSLEDLKKNPGDSFDVS